MHARLNKRLSEAREGGFTLIELLIVIVILGILAAIVVFAIGSTRGDSLASSCKTNFKSIELSAEAIKTKKGKYPVYTWSSSSTDATNPLVAGAGSGSPVVPFNNGAVLKTYPTAGNDYQLVYSASSPGDTFTITVQKRNAADTAWENADTTAALSQVVGACEKL